MIICADDYGISPAVNAGIIELVERKRISAVSCMMVGPYVSEAMEELKSLRAEVDIGLHLVLTKETPLVPKQKKTSIPDDHENFLSFNKLLTNSFCKLINYDSVFKEVVGQINCFMEYFGRYPDYIDGHQHIQQLPVIRNAIKDAIVDVIKNNSRIYVRICQLPQGWLWTKGISFSRSLALGNFFISLPAKSTGDLLTKNSIPHNRYLLGYYNYEGGKKFEDVFQRYLTLKPEDKDIFFCHPGYVDKELRERDCIIDSRIDVLEFLRSSRCDELMEQFKVNRNSCMV